jgi:hypothetical protein
VVAARQYPYYPYPYPDPTPIRIPTPTPVHIPTPTPVHIPTHRLRIAWGESSIVRAARYVLEILA